MDITTIGFDLAKTVFQVHGSTGTTAEAAPREGAGVLRRINHDRHLNRRDTFKQDRAAALAEWRQLAA